MDEGSGPGPEYSMKQVVANRGTNSKFRSEIGDSNSCFVFRKLLEWLKSIDAYNARSIFIGILLSGLITTTVFVAMYFTMNREFKEESVPANFTINDETKTNQELNVTMEHRRSKRNIEQLLSVHNNGTLDCSQIRERIKRTKILTPEFRRACYETTRGVNLSKGRLRPPEDLSGIPKSMNNGQNYNSNESDNVYEPPTNTNKLAAYISDEAKEFSAKQIPEAVIKPGIQKAAGRFPATGPSAPLTGGDITSTGLSGPGEALKTSQQLTVSLPGLVHQLCFLGPKVTGSQFSSPGLVVGQEHLPNYICTPVQKQVQTLDNMQSLQRIDVRQSTSSIHVPTAVSSPNPFFFPTVSGSPVLAQPTVSKQPTFYVKPVQQYQIAHQMSSYEKPSTIFNWQNFQPQQAVSYSQPQAPGSSSYYNQKGQQPTFDMQSPFYNAQGGVSLQPYSQNHQLSYPQPTNNIHPLQNQPSTAFNPHQGQASFYFQQPPSGTQVHSQPLTAFDPQSGVISFLPQRPSNFQSHSISLPQNPHAQNPIVVQSFPVTGSSPSSHQVYCTYVPHPNSPMQTYTFPVVPGVSEYKETSPSAEYDMFKTYDKQDSNGTRSNYATAKSAGDKMCEGDTVPCTDGLCIARASWCDSTVDCADLSDEANCSCVQRINKKKLCDGFQDCPNGEDELHCSDCGPDSFCCDDWNNFSNRPTCIRLDKRCDNQIDCPNAKDERDCILITEIIDQENKFVMSYGTGFLQRNLRGRWYPICAGFNNLNWAYYACSAEYGHLTNKPSIGASQPIGYYEVGMKIDYFNRMALSPQCGGDRVTTVNCGQMQCGTRMFNERTYEMSTYTERHKRLDMIYPFLNPTGIYPSETELQYSPRTYRNSNYVWPLTDPSYIGKLNGATWGRMTRRGPDQTETAKRSEGRVVGGIKSKPGFWPWLIALYRDGMFHCGGVIINEAWVLTAAHCVDEEDMRNDIALVHLAEPLKFNRWVRSICLPDPGYMKLPVTNDACMAVGWGSTFEDGPDPDHMHEVQVPILDSCKHRADILGDEICAGRLEGGADTCQGDSGGPLLCKIRGFTDRWYVAGLVSHGEGCGRPEEPGVYTRVYNFVSWIIKNTRLRRSNMEAPKLDCPGTQCKGGRCLSAMETCDGVVHCLGVDDETSCSSEGRGAVGVNGTRKTLPLSVPSNGSRSVEDNSVGPSITRTSNETSRYNNETSPIISPIGDKADLTVFTIPLGSNFIDEVITSFFTCKEISQDVLISRRCDGTIDCEDGTDERDCTCKDKLEKFKPDYICDGKVHCKDGCDENKCPEKCSSDQFYCSKSQKCVNKEERCNGRNDCGFNEDEIDCYALDKESGVHLDRAGRPELSDSGRAMEYSAVRGEWIPVCFDAKNPTPKAMEVCLALGYMVCSGWTVFEFEKNITVDYCTPPPYQMEPTKSCTRDIGLRVGCSSPKLPTKGEIGPWNALLYKEGELFGTAILVTTSWLVAPQSLFANINLNNTFIVAVIGVTEIKIGLLGPYDQYMRVDKVNTVGVMKTALLHLSEPARLSHQVKPIGIPDLKPRLDETCHIYVLGNDSRLSAVGVHSIEECEPGKRCFKITDPSWCKSARRQNLGGGIVCQSSFRMYLAAVFSNVNEFCYHPENVVSFASISDHHQTLKEETEKNIEYESEGVLCDTVRCETGRCLNWTNIMDNVQDCLDARDESLLLLHKKIEYCSTHNCSCPLGMIKCRRNGNCIPASTFCDGKADCDDSSDEENCTAAEMCAAYLNRTRPSALCDGSPQCYDKSDELWAMCGQKSCNLTSAFTCSKSNGCVPGVFVCDGVKDCPNGEDELACVAIESPLNKLSEGRLMTRTYGKWSPHCLSKSMPKKVLDKLCSLRGYKLAQIVTYSNAVVESTVLDIFTKLRLNDRVNIQLRTHNRPFLHKESPVNCTTVHIECLQ